MSQSYYVAGPEEASSKFAPYFAELHDILRNVPVAPASGHPGVSLAGLPERGGAGLVIVADVAAAEKALGAVGVKSADGVVVPPASGNGTMLAFVGA